MTRTRAVALSILGASVATLATAYYFQFVEDLAPCPLCLYQRYPYMVTIVLAGLLLAAGDGGRARPILVGLCGLAFTTGAGIAFYHVGVEYGWFEGLAACGGGSNEVTTIADLKAQMLAGKPAPCDQVPWSLLGVSLAGYNFAVAVVLAGLSFLAAADFAGRDPRILKPGESS